MQTLHYIILKSYKKKYQKNKKKVFFKKSQALQKCEHRRKSSKRTHKRKTRKRYTITTSQQSCSKHCKISPESAKKRVFRDFFNAGRDISQRYKTDHKQTKSISIAIQCSYRHLQQNLQFKAQHRCYRGAPRASGAHLVQSLKKQTKNNNKHQIKTQPRHIKK